MSSIRLVTESDIWDYVKNTNFNSYKDMINKVNDFLPITVDVNMESVKKVVDNAWEEKNRNKCLKEIKKL